MHAQALPTGRRPMRRTRPWSYVVSFIVAIAAILAFLPGAAAASESLGDDPDYSGCDTQHAVVDKHTTMTDPRNGNIIGTAYLIYSFGCASEWVKVVYNASIYIVSPSVWKQNQSGTDLYESGLDWEFPWGVDWTWQLEGMSTTAGCGGVQVYDAVGYVNWYYLGCE